MCPPKKEIWNSFESIFLRGRCSLKVFVGRVFITIHLHSGNMTLLRTGCLIDLDKSLEITKIYIFLLFSREIDDFLKK